MTNIILGKNQYGKAEVRVVRVTRDTDRHEIEDLNVTSQLRGDLDSAHFEGNNEHVVPTDTQKNTVYAFAKDGVGSPEEFLLRLGRHFTGEFDWITGGRWEAEQYTWQRIQGDSGEHDHSFVRGGTETRTSVVQIDRDDTVVIAGLQDLKVLKSTQSGFVGYPKDKYTTLAETEDRILATSVTAKWRYNRNDIDFNEVFADVRRLLLAGFSRNYSYALQHTLKEMAEAVLEAHPEIDEIRFSTPNSHHFVVDLSPFGLENPNEVFYAADRPYGLIEASFLREGADTDHWSWDGIAGFC
ncbi:urate oxidase [Microbacterium esteraromaticum]|nr:urate oxidase [Microbacterium esteraromaticum]